MKKIFRKNQIIITALALMIAVAGYISYTRTNVAENDAVQTTGDAYDISDGEQIGEIFTDTEDNTQTASAADSQTEENSGQDAENAQAGADAQTDADAGNAEEVQNPGETVQTSVQAQSLAFAADVKLNREQVRSKNKETLMEIINNTSIAEAQKQDAIDSMIQMTDVAEKENAAEILLEAKGFSDVVVSITDNEADVVLNMGDVTDAKRAQVEDIVKRKTGISAENIVITPLSQ
ncbi:SpoIIIAH-like family protein [uncultured Eubacterium sp.]|uniref:SpoIIIAH-like family protein n=1 Tax=uncultured Eubacterium sp. TaxID=165185 RepID=UPI0025E8FDEC|nr:SpoIIIAH-like family protein [uncultured Eubacterium sp.]MCI6536801.1 SpoIIIAH-like family protein [Lachnospiraceae bacterium]